MGDAKYKCAHIVPIFAAGVGLFSDGYLNGIMGSVNTILKILYPAEFAQSNAFAYLSSIVFVGYIVGMIVFGYLCDKIGRKTPLLLASCMLIIFSALCTGAYVNGSISGMITAMVVYRFFLGVGIGGEYPASSTAASEGTAQTKKGRRHALFVFATNFVIDMGWIISAFVPWLLLVICGMNNLGVVWRLSLGLGIICPAVMLVFRWKLEEPEAYKANSMQHIPYRLVFKRYWKRIIPISICWFIYDFVTYSFSIYSTQILLVIIPNGTLYQTFGWNTVLNLFYFPGAFLGAFVSDWLGPRWTLAVGVWLQTVFGFLMSGLYDIFVKQIAAFVVIYGLFITFGEFGPGNNIGLVAAKSAATPVRGQFYSICAAIGKVGAFCGAFAFDEIIADFALRDSTTAITGPFWIGSGLAALSGIIAVTAFPMLSQECIEEEDEDFKRYIKEEGFVTDN
jgi:MFS family permease